MSTDYSEIADSGYRQYRIWVDAQAAAREAEAEAVSAAARVELERLGTPTTAAARRVWAETFARAHHIRIDVREDVPAQASWPTRTVIVPPIRDDESLATFLHEAGHVIAGRCPETGAHRRDPAVTDAHSCLECERLAWDTAMRTAPLFSRRMFTHLRQYLGGYLRGTPAPAAVKQAAKQLSSDSHYANALQAAERKAVREDQRREMAAIAAEAARPRPLTRREQQIRDMRAWGAEVVR